MSDPTDDSQPSPPATPAPPATAKPKPKDDVLQGVIGYFAPETRADDSIKDTFESIIIAFVLAFVFRAYVVEAFVIPTGSMAPTLLGEHYDLVCQQCGYRYDTESRTGALPVRSHCPMCNFPNQVSTSAAVRSGDRILVHKFIYSITEPRRWDVVVFKDPQKPHTNFIKRLVGLPGEELRLIEGNVYVKHITDDDTLWRIARKSDRPRVQRDVWQPLYASQYIPLDQGKPGATRYDDWHVPWVVDEEPTADAWEIENRRSYRFNSADSGAIRFDFRTVRKGVPSLYPYNYNDETAYTEPIEDVRIAASVAFDQIGGVIRFETQARLDNPDRQDESLPIAAVVDTNGRIWLETDDDAFRSSTVLAEATIDKLPTGAPVDLEFWFVDQHASIWVDGEMMLSWAFDVPMNRLIERRPLTSDPTIRIAVQGSPLTMHRVEVDRDLHYSTKRRDQLFARGGVYKNPLTFETVDDGPVLVRTDRFFCMGDNSPHSHDSRYWDDVDFWVRQRMFDDDEDPMGMVPRKLMMGRAFFVYLPAPFAPKSSQPGFIPNFADMRFIH